MNFQEYKMKISNLQVDEEKIRDLYLRDIALGNIQGPITGYPSKDKPWLKWYKSEYILKQPEYTNAYDYLISSIGDDYCLIQYYGKEYYKKDIVFQVEKYISKFTEMGIKNGDSVSFIMLDVPEVIFMWLALTKMGATTNLIKFDESPERIKLMCEKGESKYLFASSVPFIAENIVKSIKLGNKLQEVIMIPITNEMSLLSIINTILENSKKDASKNKQNIFKSLRKNISDTNEMKSKVNRIISEESNMISYDDWNKKYKGIKNNSLVYNAEDNVSIIVYTGGTTGSPKAVQLTNKNIIIMAHNLKYSEIGFDPGKTSLNILPPGPAYYLNATYGLIRCEVTVNLISNFTVDVYPELIKKYKPNIFLSGPILLKSIVDQNILDDASFMTEPISGGDKLHNSEEIRFNDYVRSKGGTAVVHQGYGESESTAAATYAKKCIEKVGTIGIPLLNVIIGIFDYQMYDEFDPNVEEKQYGEIGEICITGPTIMKGYKNDIEATNQVVRLHSDGRYWLHTDDLGYVDEDGRLYHCGRAKRMLTRSGGKVWLATLEDEIKKNLYIHDVCCVKSDDDIEREVPVAFIVLKDNAPENIFSLIDEQVYNSLSDLYVPKYYVVIEKIPITTVNKKVDFKTLEESLKKDNYFQSDRVLIKKKEK